MAAVYLIAIQNTALYYTNVTSGEVLAIPNTDWAYWIPHSLQVYCVSCRERAPGVVWI